MITLLNVYAPPNSEWDFYKKIFNIMASDAEGVLICGGDFNIKLNVKLDSSRPSIRQTKTSRKINVAMQEMGLMDVWRDFFPSGRDYTHFSHPHSVYTRIDYFLMYNTERNRIIQCDIGNIDISDHSPVYLVINLNKKYRQTLWKLNSTILNSQQVKEALEDEIQTYMEFSDTGEVEPPLLWDALKAVMRGNIIAQTALRKN